MLIDFYVATGILYTSKMGQNHTHLDANRTKKKKHESNKMQLTKICKQGILINHSSIVHFYVLRTFKITYDFGTPLQITPS